MPHISLSPSPGALRRPAHPARRRAPARRAFLPWVVIGAVVTAVAVAGYMMLDASSRRVPEIAPRHRAEALCFLLAEPPAFNPPMPVQPSAALVRGRFNPGTPASYAIEQLMGFGSEHVLKQWIEHVGDYNISASWLHLPGAEREHWLVLAWMEDSDLAVCNFRFTGTSGALSGEERAWGERLVRRVLIADNFRRGELPMTRLRVEGGHTMPEFGPPSD